MGAPWEHWGDEGRPQGKEALSPAAREPSPHNNEYPITVLPLIMLLNT